MDKYIYKVLGVLSVGGGFMAIASILNSVVASGRVAGYVFGVIAFLVFSYGIWCGIKIIQSPDLGALSLNRFFWAMQVPLLSSPGVSYFLYVGFNFTVHYSFAASNPGFNASVGGNFMFSVFQISSPFLVGVNVFALIIFCYLNVAIKKLKLTES